MEIVKDFKQHLERLGYSKTSLQMLPSCLKDFLEYNTKAVAEITSADILNYHQHLQERPNKKRPGGLSESYINHHIYALKLYFGWEEEKGNITENPISSLEFKAPTSPPREILTQEEIKELYESCETLKEKAVLNLFYGCGLRRIEGEKLNLKDVHFRSNLLYVREGKNSKRRAVPMSEKVKEELKNYVLKERKAKEEEQAFIINKIGKGQCGYGLNRLFKELVSKTQISKEVSLHSLRHSIATHLLESGLPIENVRDFLGHKHLESTQIYTRVNKKQLWNLNNT